MLTKEQQEIKDYFLSFLFTDDKYLIIDGPGGTGKTYLMNELLNVLSNEYQDMCNILGQKSKYYGFIVTATTHKACNVINEFFIKEQKQNDPNFKFNDNFSRTIHSALGLKIKNDYSTGETKLEVNANGLTNYSNDVIFIDECSMIDDNLLQFIDKATHQCKVVFIGDKYQLPPVRRKLSPIYSLGATELSLGTVKRSKHKDLRDTCNMIRDVVKNNSTFSIHTSSNIEYLDDRDQKTVDWIKANIIGSTENNHILCYTNKGAREYSEAIDVLKKKTNKFNVKDTFLVNSLVKFTSGDSIRTFPTDTIVEIQSIIDENANAYSGEDNSIAFSYSLLSAVDIVSGRSGYIYAANDFDQFTKYLKKLAKDKNWSNYYYYKEHIADLRNTDVLTVHKAQGSTFDNVLIDLSDLSTCRNPDEFRRLMYVAFTRAKNKVFLTGKLSQKYGEIL